MCLDPNAMEWLHAYLVKSPPPDKIGFIYMLQGGWDFSNLDPYATKPDGGKATITGPHVMVVGPGVKMVPGTFGATFSTEYSGRPNGAQIASYSWLSATWKPWRAEISTVTGSDAIPLATT
jgi:hypothetical protein